MIGYPFFYGTEHFVKKHLDQDEKFMLFSLDPITENSELNLTQVASLPILVEPIKLQLGDEFTYQFCDEISQFCGTFRIIPETKTLVLDYDGFCRLVSKSDIIVNTLSSDLGITKQSAMEQAQNFFLDRNVIVQAGGVQGTIYKVGSYLQSAGSAGFVAVDRVAVTISAEFGDGYPFTRRHPTEAKGSNERRVGFFKVLPWDRR